MRKHVLVVALSTFTREEQDGRTVMPETSYVYEDLSDEQNRTFHCTGHYQLEPIPRFITFCLKETITDVLLLETEETRDPDKGLRKQVFPAPNGGMEGWAGTASLWYREWLRHALGDKLRIESVEIDETKPADALEKVVNRIRTMYKQVRRGESWRLWFDTHGAFRDISSVLASAARMFAVDEKKPIRTDGIFSIYHSQKEQQEDRIVNQTAFYFSESTRALKNYLNYGQYLSVRFHPREDGPYAFISYRHDERYLTSVRNVFTKFEELELPYWYDDGIHYRSDWVTTLEEKNRDAKVFIALLTNSYFSSPECWKELLRAIAGKQDRSVHFILLQKNIRIPFGIPEKEKFAEVRALQEELGITDGELNRIMKGSFRTQWIKWYSFMGDAREIEDRNLSDRELKENLLTIRNQIVS